MSFHSKVNGRTLVASSFSGGIATGGNVRTPCGARHVELVRPGDLIVTRDGGLQPVRLVLKRSVRIEGEGADPDAAPVRLRPRAIGPMMPQRDVLVAPDHRVLVPGYRLADVPDTTCCLVGAADLAATSDAAFVDRSKGEVDYYTLVFDSHFVFCVNGLPVESFLPTRNAAARLDAPTRAEVEDCFPQLRETDIAYPPAKYRVLDAAKYLPLQA